MASSSTPEDEREEKRLSLLNHIINVHTHDNSKIFKKCTHEVLDRDWLKPGVTAMYLCVINIQFAH